MYNKKDLLCVLRVGFNVIWLLGTFNLIFFFKMHILKFSMLCYFIQFKYIQSPLSFVFVDLLVLYLYFTCQAGMTSSYSVAY